MIAALCTWHEDHEIPKAEMDRSFRNKEILIFSTYSLVETYAVLTPLTPLHRLSMQDAFTLLEANRGGAEVVALTGKNRYYYETINISREHLSETAQVLMLK